MNKRIIKLFEKLIKQLKFQSDNASRKEQIIYGFKIKSFKNAIKTFQKLNFKIKNTEDIQNLKGIGRGILNRVDEILKTGKLKELKLNKEQELYLKQIKKLETVIGIGRKKAHELITKHNITNIIELKNSNIKLNDQILLGLKYYDKFKQNIPRKEMRNIEIYLRNKLSIIYPKAHGQVCGSYRREQKTSGDIDFLFTHPKIKTMKQLSNTNILKEYVNILNIIIDNLSLGKSKYMGFCKLEKHIRRIDIRFVPFTSYYTALLYFTGSSDFNKQMRSIAIEQNYLLNEYGLFKNNKQIKIKSEKHIFDILNMEYVLPKNR